MVDLEERKVVKDSRNLREGGAIGGEGDRFDSVIFRRHGLMVLVAMLVRVGVHGEEHFSVDSRGVDKHQTGLGKVFAPIFQQLLDFFTVFDLVISPELLSC